MIPGIIRGVIASSWLRPSEELRAPNSLTTGQEIPFVEFRVPEIPRSEWFAGVRVPITLASKNPQLEVKGVARILGQNTKPFPIRVRTTMLIKKV